MTVTDAPPTNPARAPSPAPAAGSPGSRWSDRAARLAWVWAALATLLAVDAVWLARALSGGVPDRDDWLVTASAVATQAAVATAAAIALRRAAAKRPWLPLLLLLGVALLAPPTLDVIHHGLPPSLANPVGRFLGAAWRRASAWGLGPGIVLFDLWTWTPFVALVALVGFRAIPPVLYEVAEVDRVGRWFRLRHIAGPLVGPVLLAALVYRAVDTLLSLVDGQDARRVALAYALVTVAFVAGGLRRGGSRA